jgi:serine/threonine protein kinase
MDLKQRLENIGLELLEANVGEGGSAFVHKAQVMRKTSNLPIEGTLVAVKEYKPSILSISGQIERIRQEAHVGQSIRHGNLIITYDLLDDKDSPLLLLEWIDGSTLESWVEKLPSDPPWELVKDMALGIAEALKILHQGSVFHRDIKPENVMIENGKRSVLMDVGVAELTANNEHTLHTSIKDFVGSVRTASPQFILGESYDIKDDIYSLGATCHYLFTGRRIYDEVERKPLLPIAVVNSSPKIAKLIDDIPSSIKILLEASLHRTRDRRPTINEFIECLESPTDARFLTNEIEKQGTEKRGYNVIEIIDHSSFLVDLAGDRVNKNAKFTVVRKLSSIRLPSYQREVNPEIWVAEAVLKHTSQNIGHFVTLEKKWEAKNTGLSALNLGGKNSGTWVEEESYTSSVAVDDLVLKDSRR